MRKTMRNAPLADATDACRCRHNISYCGDASPAASSVVGFFTETLKYFEDSAAHDPVGYWGDNEWAHTGLPFPFAGRHAHFAREGKHSLLQLLPDLLEIVEPVSIELTRITLGPLTT